MIPGLPSIGGGELLILLSIVLLFFGAKRLPQMGRSLGRGIKEFKEGLTFKEDPEKAEESTPRLQKRRSEPKKAETSESMLTLPGEPHLQLFVKQGSCASL